jgi:hypothetical protein
MPIFNSLPVLSREVIYPLMSQRGIAATKFYHRGKEAQSNGRSPVLCVASEAGGEKIVKKTGNRRIVVRIIGIK